MLRLLCSVCACVLWSSTGFAAEPEDSPPGGDVDPAARLGLQNNGLVAVPLVIASEAYGSGWNLVISLRELSDSVDPASAQWHIELYSNEHKFEDLIVAGSEVEISVAADSVADGKHLMITADLVLADEESGVGYQYLQRRGEALVLESWEDYEEGRTQLFGDNRIFMGAVSDIPCPPEYQHIVPWENPAVNPEDREWARAQYAQMTSDGSVESRHGALQASDDQAEETETGCSSGDVGASLLMVPFSLLMFFRRRAAPLVLALVMVGQVHQARADTVVSGYVAFWDSRTGSNLPGSRLNTCDATVTSCTVNGTIDGNPNSAKCCIRGIPYVTVHIVNGGGVIKHTVLTNENGMFVFPPEKYDPFPYTVAVQYKRDVAPTMMEVTSSGAIFQTTAGTPFPVSGTILNIGQKLVNTAPDTSSHEGNVATAWHALTKSFIAMELDNEIRQRKTLGSPPNTFDKITYKYNLSGYSVCPSNFKFLASVSRDVRMHELAGETLLGRVTGCDSGEGSDLIASWPVTLMSYRVPNMAPTSEGAGLGLGIQRLVTMLTRFNPAVTSAMDARGGAGYSCGETGVDTFPNSNSASWPNNNATALWELLDSDTTNADDGVSDTVNTDLNAIVTAVAANGAATDLNGDSITDPDGTNHTEQEWGHANTTNTCSTNESCGNGQVCGHWTGTLYCWAATGSGRKVHGGNIGDMMYFMSGGSAVSNTVKSSVCIRGGSDSAHPFNGSHRD